MGGPVGGAELLGGAVSLCRSGSTGLRVPLLGRVNLI